MKRSEINQLIRDASECFQAHGWTLPPHPRWDVTDFGLGDWRKFGLVLVNLAEEPEYCEKLMYARKGMLTPAHCHRAKKEDIIARWGMLRIAVWPRSDRRPPFELLPGSDRFDIKINGEIRAIVEPVEFILNPGERVTLMPGIYHEFEPASDECIIGEVSTANDDLHDNFFIDPGIGRYPGIEEDEEALLRLLSESQ